LLDPTIEIVPTNNQINHLITQLKKQIAKKERTLITVLTIKMAESLTNYLNNQKIKVMYLHNELKTLQRTQIINDLRRGKYDVIVGINLLREGLDIPEVSLIAIFDADSPGFFRNEKSLIQTFGRAARNEHGHIILYADQMTDAMKKAISETNRRRKIQEQYNKKNHITPKTIIKSISDIVSTKGDIKVAEALFRDATSKNSKIRNKSINILHKQMMDAAKNHEYERAAYLRDMILELEGNLNKV
jgi:excinuclease ABC subunit B